jgi:YjbE family integral membrane protein
VNPADFVSALLAIVVIDIALAGDNAIVIALAARALPPPLRRRAIVAGAIGAIVVRSGLAVAVVSLLTIPGLLFAGGATLVWIAYRLLRPANGDGNSAPAAASTLWGAMRTIVIADALMGLDNILGVAGAAHGSHVLVVIGLLISVPIVVWGSTLVLQLVDRYPAVVYLGAAVLLWTAVRMMIGEPLLRPWLDAVPLAVAAAHVVIPTVLWVAFVRNHRHLESRIHARLTELAAGQAPRAAAGAPAAARPEGGRPMLEVLVPVDGSANALRAVRHVIDEYQRGDALEVHLLNVQPRLSRHIARFVARRDRNAFHRERAQAAITAASEALDRAGVPYRSHWVVGERATEICRAARRLGVHHIVIGTARRNSITRMLEDSVTLRVLEATPVPVEVVPGKAVAAWERWLVPLLALAIGGGLIWLALD